MGKECTGDAARDLRDRIGKCDIRLDLAAEREDQRHGRIEMRAGNPGRA